MKVFAIMGQIAAANLEMMDIQRYANLLFAKPFQLLEHRLKSALVTLAELSDRVFTHHLRQTNPPTTLKALAMD